MVGARYLTLIAAVALAVPAADLKAQQPWGPAGSVYGPYAPRYSQVAQDEGYRRGLVAGQNDRRRGEPFSFTNESEYRRADLGYRSEFGSRDRYREDFRTGFAAGYRVGYGNVDSRRIYGPPGPPPWANGRARGRGSYDGYGGYGSYGGYGDGYGGYHNQVQRYDLAFDNGYNDGYEEGLNDGRKRHTNDPIAESRYRSGDHGYERYYGSFETYKLNYREGFRQGYERGFTDGWSYRY